MLIFEFKSLIWGEVCILGHFVLRWHHWAGIWRRQLLVFRSTTSWADDICAFEANYYSHFILGFRDLISISSLWHWFVCVFILPSAVLSEGPMFSWWQSRENVKIERLFTPLQCSRFSPFETVEKTKMINVIWLLHLKTPLGRLHWNSKITFTARIQFCIYWLDGQEV